MTEGQHESVTKPLLNPAVYDALKKFALVWLPGLGAAYFSLSAIWGLPFAEQIVGTIAVIDTFLGLGLRVSSKRYYNKELNFDGEMVVGSDANRVLFNEEMENLEGKDVLQLKVVHPPVE